MMHVYAESSTFNSDLTEEQKTLEAMIDMLDTGSVCVCVMVSTHLCAYLAFLHPVAELCYLFFFSVFYCSVQIVPHLP